MNEIAIVKDLRVAGFSQEQSETLAESISKGIVGGSATKSDIARLESRLSALESKINIMLPMMTAMFGVILLWLLRHFCKHYERPQRGNPLTTGAFWAREWEICQHGMI